MRFPRSTTVATTPLTKLLYPPWYQQEAGEVATRRDRLGTGTPLQSSISGQEEQAPAHMLDQTQIRRLLVFLRLDSLPSLFTFISLLGGEEAGRSGDQATEKLDESSASNKSPRRHWKVHGLRILELTERTSTVMQVTEGEEYSQRDPVVNTFRTFSQLHDVAVSGRVAMVPAGLVR